MPSANVAWGLEVGAGSIKALKLERDGDSLKVADFVVLPHKKVLSTPELNKDDAIAVALGAFMSQYRDALKGATIAVSVPGHSAFARFAKLPPVEKKGIANLVKFEAVQQIPFPIDDVEWDYQTFASDDSPEVEVGIFAMTKAKANELLAQYGDQGLVPDVITLSPLAAYNAIAYDLAFTAQTPGTVILDIGTTASDLIIADSGKVWIRTFPLGGHNFTEALAATFKLAYGKAERLKREAETSKYKRHIFQAMKPVLQELVQDVQRSIAYYRDTHPEAKISRLIVCGSTVKLLGLRKILSQQLQLDVFKLERFKRPQLEGAASADFEAATPMMATAYGLALQGLGLYTIGANLMPIPVIRAAMWKRKTPWFVAAAAMGIAAGGLSFLRPALDSMAVNSVKADAKVTNPIRQAISSGNALKQEWQSASTAAQPGFVAQNVVRLLDGRRLYELLLRDASSMFVAAAEHAKGQSAVTIPEDRAVATIVSMQTQYLPPSTPFNASAAGNQDPFGAGGGGAASSAGGEANAAGPAGAVRVTLTFDAPTDSRAFINDSFLAWLRASAQRADVPYTLVGIPKADQISPVAQAVAGQVGGPAGGGAPPQPSSGRGFGGDGEEDDGTSLGGGKGPGAGQPPAQPLAHRAGHSRQRARMPRAPRRQSPRSPIASSQRPPRAPSTATPSPGTPS
jgi:type IV pilus assembly protein PilM